MTWFLEDDDELCDDDRRPATLEEFVALQKAARRDVLSVRGMGRRGGVVVQVTALGRLTDLRLTDAAVQRPAPQLAAAIVDAALLAQLDAARVAVQVAEEVWGRRSADVESLREEVEYWCPASTSSDEADE